MAHAKSAGMSAVALTDNGVMHGAIAFYMAAKAAGLTPIIGCELAFTDRIDQKVRARDRLIVLAMSNRGYQQLVQLVSAANIEGFYYTPRIDWGLLEQFNEDLIVITHGYQGPVANCIKQHQDAAAHALATRLKALMGDRLYLGIQRLGESQEESIIQETAELGKTLSIPLVVTNDVYYEKPSDARLRTIVNCIQQGKTLESNTRLSLRSEAHDFKSPDAMDHLFSDYPEALAETGAIASRIHISMETEQVLLPVFECPNGLSKEDYLAQLVWAGIQKKYKTVTQEIQDRVAHELQVIQRMGFSFYFLIIYDFLNYCYAQFIPVGPGRGSAAGSIVAYALDITQVDPLPYNLLFERFLNPDRISMPDIDLDFCIKRRHEVVDYLVKRYGEAHVAQIATFGTMAPRGVIRDVGRVLNIPLVDVDRLAKLIPSQPGHYVSIAEALEQVSDLRELCLEKPELANLLEQAKPLEGVPRHTSTHAAGVVISRDPLSETVPLMRNDDQVATQYPMGDLETIGLLKMDILGLRNLTVIQEAVDLIRAMGISVDMASVSLNDSDTYALLASGHTTGIFQLESQGMRQLIVDLAPSTFEDVVALLALYRPGPLGSGMVSDFISNKKGDTETTYSVPELAPILSDTYGMILYQEQVMQIASVIGGFTLSQADMLRRAMGKKKKSVMDDLKAQFMSGAEARGFDSDKAGAIFQLCYKFSEYGFNKSHSVAYALVSYQTAYLKTHYPVQYMIALLNSVQSDNDKTSLYVHEVRRLGIAIQLPNINTSHLGATQAPTTDSTIRFGLGGIRNVGEQAIESIIAERASGPYTTMRDFLMRVDLRHANKRVIESLIKSGCFSECNTREVLLHHYVTDLEWAQRQVKAQKNGQQTLFGWTDTQPDTAAVDTRVPALAPEQLLGFEKEMLGVYLSGHPLDSLAIQPDNQVQTVLKTTSGHASVQVVGVLTGCRLVQSKSGKKMGVGTLADQTHSVNVLVFEQDDAPAIFESFYDDAVVTISGIIRCKSDDERTLTARVITPMQSSESKRALHVDVNAVLYSQAMVDQVHSMIKMHPGDCRVFVHANDTVVLAGMHYGVSDSCMPVLQAILGRAAVWMTN